MSYKTNTYLPASSFPQSPTEDRFLKQTKLVDHPQTRTVLVTRLGITHLYVKQNRGYFRLEANPEWTIILKGTSLIYPWLYFYCRKKKWWLATFLFVATLSLCNICGIRWNSLHLHSLSSADAFVQSDFPVSTSTYNHNLRMTKTEAVLIW